MTQQKITLKELKAKASPFKPANILIAILVLCVIAQSWIDTQMSLSALFSGYEHILSYLAGNKEIPNSGFFPPNLESEGLAKYCLAMLETLQMAVIAIVLSVIFALPLSFLCSRNILEIIFPQKGWFFALLRRTLYLFATLLANICRSVNEIVWALIFVSAVGLGPMAGILALAVHTTGALAKLLSEGNESIDPGPIKALDTMGVGFIKTLCYGIIPQVMPHYISMILYRFESDVRSASILGFVGAGGIGFYLFDSIRAFENGSVCTILIVIVASVFVIDKVSAFIRKRYI
ncbi:phosphonate ABC transporter, permease protein PhnE [uncultured Helicobacter sp.]|uniref:phosphonate ABC transporter, permease protein PhnE n=1 Tax=uncultured Helicobacter sp. TaxID=175537 RepID=UPI003752B3F2